MSRQPLFNLRTIFEQKLESERRERELIVKSRLESFHNRHRAQPGTDPNAGHNEAKGRHPFED